MFLVHVTSVLVIKGLSEEPIPPELSKVSLIFSGVDVMCYTKSATDKHATVSS